MSAFDWGLLHMTCDIWVRLCDEIIHEERSQEIVYPCVFRRDCHSWRVHCGHGWLWDPGVKTGSIWCLLEELKQTHHSSFTNNICITCYIWCMRKAEYGDSSKLVKNFWPHWGPDSLADIVTLSVESAMCGRFVSEVVVTIVGGYQVGPWTRLWVVSNLFFLWWSIHTTMGSYLAFPNVWAGKTFNAAVWCALLV